MFQLSKRLLHRPQRVVGRSAGERSGYATNYSSDTIGISHQFNDLVMIRPEIGYYHSYNVPAFDLGKSSNRSCTDLTSRSDFDSGDMDSAVFPPETDPTSRSRNAVAE